MESASSIQLQQVNDQEITRLWTSGLTGKSLGLPLDQTQVSPGQDSSSAESPFGAVSAYYAIQGSVVGKGSFGVARLCRHVKSSTECVLKCVPNSSVGESYFREHVERDMFATLLKMPPHPNVVQFLDFLLSPDMVFVVMEPLKGEDLSGALSGKKVTELFCRDVMKQALSALAHIHSVGIIHRDVKLDALRFRRAPNDELVLFDFGHCCHVLVSQEEMDIVGTPLYMAPDVFTREYTTQVDLWGLGVTFYAMLVGEVPFHAEGPPRAVSNEALQIALSSKKVQELPDLPSDLLRNLLVASPSGRLNASSALQHQWFVQTLDTCSSFDVEEIGCNQARSLVLHHGLSEHLYGKSLATFAVLTQVEGHCMTGIPHENFVKEEGLTFNEAVVTMIINCVGAGVVLFPKIMADMGILLAPLLCTLCAFTCLECGIMITAGCAMAEEVLGVPIRTYEEFASSTAPSLKVVLMITKNSAFIGFLVAYMQLILDSIVTLNPDWKEYTETIRFGVVLPCFCLLAMIKDLKQLASFSSLGLAAVVIECCCIMVGGVILMCQTKSEYTVGPIVATSELPGYMGKYVATFLFSFAILGTVPSVRSQLKDPSQMHSVLSTSFMILILINCVVMFLGYLGAGTKTQDNVVMEFAGTGTVGKTISSITSSAVIVNVLLSSPLYIFCVMAVVEASGHDAIRTPMTLPNISFRILCMLVLCIVGSQLPFVGEIISLVASVFGVCNNIFLPAIFHFSARKNASTTAQHPHLRIAKYSLAVVVGICVLVFGFKGSLETLLKKMAAAKAVTTTAANTTSSMIIFD